MSIKVRIHLFGGLSFCAAARTSPSQPQHGYPRPCGVDINRLAQLLGHANIEKTAIYTHTEDEELTEAVRKL